MMALAVTTRRRYRLIEDVDVDVVEAKVNYVSAQNRSFETFGTFPDGKIRVAGP